MFLLHPRFLVDVFSFVLQRIFISQTTDFHFANYKFSFRKLQISISQTTDFHFANYRFSFRFVPFRFVSFRFAPFRFANYSKPLKSLLPDCWVCIEKGLHRNFYSLHSKPLTLLLTLSCRKTLMTWGVWNNLFRYFSRKSHSFNVWPANTGVELLNSLGKREQKFEEKLNESMFTFCFTEFC